MPGLLVHVAIASEYVKKHKKEIKDVEKFIIGNITPDIIENKEYSHYYNKGKDTINFDKFLHDKNIKIDEDYYKGYLLHLLADETFYYYYFKNEYQFIKDNKLNFYNDWDVVTKRVIKDYKLRIIPKEIEKYTKCESKQGEKHIDYKKLKKYIKRISSIGLDEQIENLSDKNKIIV